MELVSPGEPLQVGYLPGRHLLLPAREGSAGPHRLPWRCASSRLTGNTCLSSSGPHLLLAAPPSSPTPSR